MSETTDEGSPHQQEQTNSQLAALRAEIEALHTQAGAPSVRLVAGKTSHAISHTTVHAVLQCKKLPAWGQLELVVEQLGGNVDEFKKLWVDARRAKRRPVATSNEAKPREDSDDPAVDSETFDDNGSGNAPQARVLAEMLQDLLDDIEQVGIGQAAGVPTGFIDLDKLLNGLKQGQLTVVAGLPAIGKSMFVLTVARNAAVKHNIPVLFMSFRMAQIEVVRRFFAAEARVPLHVLSSGQLSDEDWTKLARRFGEVSEAPFFVYDNHEPNLQKVLDESRRLATEHDLGLLVIDSVRQLAEMNHPSPARPKEIEISRALKNLAIELQIPVIAVDSIRHYPENSEGEPLSPTIEDLNGVDNDADVVIVVHRDDFYDLMSPRAGEADFIVVKHRNGPTDTVTVAAQLHLARFVDMAM